MNSKKNPIYSDVKTKGKRKLVIFKHTDPVYLSQSKTGHIATENRSHNFRFPLALLLRFIVSFSSSLKYGEGRGWGGGVGGVYLVHHPLHNFSPEVGGGRLHGNGRLQGTLQYMYGNGTCIYFTRGFANDTYKSTSHKGFVISKCYH